MHKNITYRTGYSNARMDTFGQLIIVTHSPFSTKRETGTAARECNYLAGNWGTTRLRRGGTHHGWTHHKSITYYYVDKV